MLSPFSTVREPDHTFVPGLEHYTVDTRRQQCGVDGVEQVARSLRYAYIGRKLRKREFRRLWITRINAAARLNGMSYSKFIAGLKKQNIEVNRKMLADLAVNDAEGFAKLVEMAKG